jgi:hypothetical protein
LLTGTGNRRRWGRRKGSVGKTHMEELKRHITMTSEKLKITDMGVRRQLLNLEVCKTRNQETGESTSTVLLYQSALSHQERTV